MAKRVEKLRENNKKKLIIDVAKCVELTDMLAGPAVVPATRGGN